MTSEEVTIQEESDNLQDTSVTQTKLISVMYVVASADFALLCFAAYLVFRVHKLVGFRDLPMLLSILSVALALTAFLTYSVLLIVQANLITEH